MTLSLLLAGGASVGGGGPALAGGDVADAITGVWEGRLVQGATGNSGMIMLSGKYTWHSVPRFQGSAISITLKKISDAELSGNGLSTQVNRPFSVLLKRAK